MKVLNMLSLRVNELKLIAVIRGIIGSKDMFIKQLEVLISNNSW